MQYYLLKAGLTDLLWLIFVSCSHPHIEYEEHLFVHVSSEQWWNTPMINPHTGDFKYFDWIDPQAVYKETALFSRLYGLVQILLTPAVSKYKHKIV